MRWIVMAIVTPIHIAWIEGSNYAFEFFVFCVGAIQYISFCLLETFYIKRRTPEALEAQYEGEVPILYQKAIEGKLNIPLPIDETQLVPRWVVVMGLTGIGFALAGIITIILISCNLIEYRESLLTVHK
ncbi:MAG: hypothetical protein OXN20_08430 [Gemmatimonadota bacterium]|nr:hypothetical protein [Gemmatimonadota bacterium]